MEIRMKNVTNQKTTAASKATGKQRSYNEIIDYLETHWMANRADTTLSSLKQLDKALGSLSQKVPTVIIAGTNGKSLTAHFTTRLLLEEGLTVGTFYTPHLLTYNERFVLNNETISNKTFTDVSNEVINTAEELNLTLNSFELLTIMALVYFKQSNVDVAILEVNENGPSDATNICSSKIVAITRIIDPQASPNAKSTDEALIQEILSIVKPGAIVVSADQSKLNLQTMQNIVVAKNAEWAMPIRKLAPLAYPFEQLHGRCAALAERITSVYINSFAHKDAVLVTNSLLTKKKGQRGRPTLEVKRQTELNPKRTIEQFWKETLSSLPGHFQLLDKEKPTILLDPASNLDAFKNLLLGTRLLHYKRPLKGLTIILGCNNEELDIHELIKLLRYFFKKTSGQVIICPVNPIPGHKGNKAWDVEKVTNDIKSLKIKAKATSSFTEALEAAQKTVDERHGVIVITGSTSIVSEYWKNKGLKKLSS
jgi:dihydrofolate synthase/folylpolyglutamate synthase